MRKYHKIKKFWTVALFVTALAVCICGQKTTSKAEWEITFGEARGRFHEDAFQRTVAGDGRVTYLNEKNETVTIGRISESDVDKITELINRLDLSKAKKIPSRDFNGCIGSMHLPNIYFVLKQNGQTYSLSHCNGFRDKKYEYTLNLSVKQKSTYKKLRGKLESLVIDKIESPSEKPEKTD